MQSHYISIRKTIRQKSKQKYKEETHIQKSKNDMERSSILPVINYKSIDSYLNYKA